MSSNIIDKNQLIYIKPTTKKLQLTRLSIKSDSKNEKKSQRKRKTEYLITYTKTPSKSKIIDGKNLQQKIKSAKKSSKKRQNKFFIKKIPEKEKSCFLNLNINKIINQKDSSILRRSGKTSNGIIGNSYKSNSNNSTNKKNINVFHEKDIYKSIKRKKFESDIANIIISKTTKINSNNTTIKMSNNKKRLNLLSPKEPISNKFTSKFNNNDDNSKNLCNFELKLGQPANIKCKKSNNQKNNFNDFLGKELNYNNLNRVK